MGKQHLVQLQRNQSCEITFWIFFDGDNALLDFSKHVKSYHHTFSLQWKRELMVIFADVLVNRREIGTLQYHVYRKPVNTDLYLHKSFNNNSA